MVLEREIQHDLKRKRIGTAKENTHQLLKNVDELRAAEIRDSDVLTKVCIQPYANPDPKGYSNSFFFFSASSNCLKFQKRKRDIFAYSLCCLILFQVFAIFPT